MNLESDFQVLFDQQRYSEIIEKARSFGITTGTQPVLSKFLAGAYFCVGEYSDAESILIELESSFADDANFLSLFAATSRRLSNFQRAERLFLKALQLQPDSIQIRNNYANLLIDLSEFDKARTLLLSVLEIQPSYREAIDNLNRLDQLVNSRPTDDCSSAHSTGSANTLSFQDPLLFAFDQSEIDHSLARYKMRSKGQEDIHNPLLDLPDPDARAVALEQLDAARQAFQEKRFELALKLCSQSFRSLGPNSDLYDLISDIYLNLHRYHEAEIFLLHAVALQGFSLKRCFNLVSFSMMRDDFILASSYLNRAAQIDPSSKDLERLRNLLHEQNSKSNSIFSFANKPST